MPNAIPSTVHSVHPSATALQVTGNDHRVATFTLREPVQARAGDKLVLDLTDLLAAPQNFIKPPENESPEAGE